jgi:hypothetical protein
MVTSFEYWIGRALTHMQRLPAPRTPGARRLILGDVAGFLRRALTEANRLGDASRKALCLRLLNWLRADLRRLA